MIWLERVAAYLDELERVTQALSTQIQRVEVEQLAQSTTVTSAATEGEMSDPEVDDCIPALAACLCDLEEKVSQRELLLRATDGPEDGMTLSEKLAALGDRRSLALQERCTSVAEVIADINNRAVSLFVCQFHLANLTDEIVRIMAGVTEPKTYCTGTKQTALGGNLFNESA